MFSSQKVVKSFGIWILAGIFCGAAILTKGVVGFIPFGVIFLLEIYDILIVKKQFSFVKYILFTLASFGIFLPWHIEMYRRYGMLFIDNYLLYHVLERATSSIEDKGRPFFWYVEVLKVSMRIWFVALIPAFVYTTLQVLFKKSREHSTLLLWAIFVFLLFSASTSKLVWYIAPIYPALCIIAARFIERLLDYLIKTIPVPDTAVVKFLVLYAITVIALFYLFLNREMVYTSDLTGPQSEMLELKNQKFPKGTDYYVDTVDEPLVLFYGGEPYYGIAYRDLRLVLSPEMPNSRDIIFITKESRFLQIQELNKRILLVGQKKEWVLGLLPRDGK